METEETVKHIYLVLDGIIHAAAPVDGDEQGALVEALKKLASSHVTSYRIVETGAVHLSASNSAARLAQVIICDGYQRGGNAKDLVGGRQLPSVMIEKSELAFDNALAGFAHLAASVRNESSDKTENLQVAYDKLKLAAQHAAVAHPPLEIDYRGGVDGILAQSGWKLNSDEIASRIASLSIATLTEPFDWEAKRAVMFKYSMSGEAPWIDAFAFVQETGSGWTFADPEQTWLHERRRQHGLNEAEVRAVHSAVQAMAESRPTTW